MTEMTPKPRIFKIGATRIVEDASTSGLSAEAIRERLRVDLPIGSDGTIPLSARAWAVKGTR